MNKTGIVLAILTSCSIGGCMGPDEYMDWVDSTWGIPPSRTVNRDPNSEYANNDPSPPSLIEPSQNSSSDPGPRSYYNSSTGRWYGEFNQGAQDMDIQKVREKEAYDEYKMQQQKQNEAENRYHLQRVREMREWERRSR